MGLGERAPGISEHRNAPVAWAAHACVASTRGRVALLREVLVTEREETVSGGMRHEDREVARLRQRSLAAVAHAHGHVAPDAVVVSCLQQRAPRVGLAQLLVVGVAHLDSGSRRQGHRLCCRTRHSQHQ